MRSAMSHLVLPSVVLSALSMGVLARITRASMLAVLEQQYVQPREPRGWRSVAGTGKHALRNAGIPIVTVVGLQFGNLVGAVLTESIFGRGSDATPSRHRNDRLRHHGLRHHVRRAVRADQSGRDVARALNPRVRA
jgi:hypothetical protein